MSNMRIWERVCTTPANARKPIEAGRLKGKTDISPMWRIRMLTEMFGPCGIGWKVDVVEKEMVPGDGSEVRCFVHLNLFFREGEQWSDPIPGFGGSSYTTKEKSGVYTDDECYKKAFTDAFGSACKLLGFSEDIFIGSYGSKYEERNKPPQAPQSPADVVLPNEGYFRQLAIGGMTIRSAYGKRPKELFALLTDKTAPAWLTAGIKAAAQQK